MAIGTESPRPATIYDVAFHAGVSIATVSRVLRGSCPTSAPTRQKVLRAVEELDYVPLRATKVSSTARNEAHGLVIPGLVGPYFADLLVGYESTANQYGQSLVVVTAGGRASLEPSIRALVDRVDGIVLTHGTVDDDVVRSLTKITPVVLLGRGPVEGCDAVVVENARGATGLTNHLLQHGRTRLVFAGDSSVSFDIRQRYEGFLLALEGCSIREAGPPIRVHYEEKAAAAVVEEVLSRAHDVDALVCANDELAMATMVLLMRAGIRVPDDVAVVGFDDIRTARYVSPGLTTVRQPTSELGRWGAIRLHEQIQGRGHVVEPQIVPTRLVIRGSCGCPWSGPELPMQDVPAVHTVGVS